jgi:hypothetical protein
MGADNVQAGPDFYGDGFMHRAKFEYKYTLWPRRCRNTKRRLWLEVAVRGRAIWTGPGEPVVEDRWYDSNEALIMMIKKVSK